MATDTGGTGTPGWWAGHREGVQEFACWTAAFPTPSPPPAVPPMLPTDRLPTTPSALPPTLGLLPSCFPHSLHIAPCLPLWATPLPPLTGCPPQPPLQLHPASTNGLPSPYLPLLTDLLPAHPLPCYPLPPQLPLASSNGLPSTSFHRVSSPACVLQQD